MKIEDELILLRRWLLNEKAKNKRLLGVLEKLRTKLIRLDREVVAMDRILDNELKAALEQPDDGGE